MELDLETVAGKKNNLPTYTHGKVMQWEKEKSVRIYMYTTEGLNYDSFCLQNA